MEVVVGGVVMVLAGVVHAVGQEEAVVEVGAVGVASVAEAVAQAEVGHVGVDRFVAEVDLESVT